MGIDTSDDQSTGRTGSGSTSEGAAPSGRQSLWVIPLVQLILLSVACVAGYYYTRDFRIIPRSMLSLPPVYVSIEDLMLITRIYISTAAVQIALLLWRCKTHGVANPQRFASEYLAYLVVWTASALYIFLATTINYDPQLVAAIGLFSTAAYLVLYAVNAAFTADQARLGAAITGLASALGQVIRRAFTPVGMLIVLFFLTPLVLGIGFTKNKDIANVVTQVRIALNPVPEGQWGFRSLLPGLVFEQPIQVAQLGGDDAHLYVLERVGRVLKVPRDGTGAPELIIDITERLGAVEVENGALGMAFHPGLSGPLEEQAHPYLYLYYTDTRPEKGQANQLSRFDLSLPSTAQRSNSETSLMTLYRTDSGYHNGGGLVFGPDGYLYVAVGEGVKMSDSDTSADALRAGILRVDVTPDAVSGLPIEEFPSGRLEGYRVPSDNPFVNNPQVRNEYWVLGLRNPFRISFDDDGNLWVGDVGSTVWEEVNVVSPGRHYGYPMIEGREATGKKGPDNFVMDYQEPIYTYVHTAYDRAVIGGIVVRDSRYYELVGDYVFADNYSGKLFAMPANESLVEEVELLARTNQFAQRGPSSVMQLESGEILITTLGAASQPSGEILELVPIDEARPELPEVLTVASASNSVSPGEAQSLFEANCARCHGKAGDGQSPDAEALGVPLPNFASTDYFSSRDRDYIRAVIAEGGAAHNLSVLMPPWAAVLEPAELEALVEYIETLGAQAQ